MRRTGSRTGSIKARQSLINSLGGTGLTTGASTPGTQKSLSASVTPEPSGMLATINSQRSGGTGTARTGRLGSMSSAAERKVRAVRTALGVGQTLSLMERPHAYGEAESADGLVVRPYDVGVAAADGVPTIKFESVAMLAMKEKTLTIRNHSGICAPFTLKLERLYPRGKAMLKLRPSTPDQAHNGLLVTKAEATLAEDIRDMVGVTLPSGKPLLDVAHEGWMQYTSPNGQLHMQAKQTVDERMAALNVRKL